MKTERNILIAFLLNLAFSLFELVGGILTGSVAIVSDAVHDFGDAASIGIACLLERKSKQPPDETCTYGYARYSVLGSLITTLILSAGSVVMICSAIGKIITPAEIHYNGMIVFAVIGVCVNFCAAFFTREGASLNQKAVNLHMLEDVLGWAVVLAGSIVMRLTDFALIDPIMSIGVSLFILIHAVKNLKEAADLFLEKAPHTIKVAEIQEHIEKIDGVLDVHHLHIWSMDGHHNLATAHIVTDSDPRQIKTALRAELARHGLSHVTLELEKSTEPCRERSCRMELHTHPGHHHHP